MEARSRSIPGVQKTLAAAAALAMLALGWPTRAAARMHPIAERITRALATGGRAVFLVARSMRLRGPRVVRPRAGLLALSAALLWLAQPALAQFTQQGPKLVGSGASGNAQQGTSVALSVDGNTAIVGGFADNSFAGAAWVFTRSGGVWTQQGNKLVGSGAAGNAQQGISVALSADGNTAIVGGRGDNARVGAAW